MFVSGYTPWQYSLADLKQHPQHFLGLCIGCQPGKKLLHTHPLATHVPVSCVAENYLCLSQKTAKSPKNDSAVYLFQTRQTSAGMSETRQAYDHSAYRFPAGLWKYRYFNQPLTPTVVARAAERILLFTL